MTLPPYEVGQIYRSIVDDSLFLVLSTQVISSRSATFRRDVEYLSISVVHLAATQYHAAGQEDRLLLMQGRSSTEDHGHAKVIP